jgi:hypothetical protein
MPVRVAEPEVAGPTPAVDVPAAEATSQQPSTAALAAGHRKVERAIRASVRSGDHLKTPARGAPFVVERVDDEGVVLLLGPQRAWTRFRWPTLEGAVHFLDGRGWVEIGSAFDTSARPGTLDWYLKQHVKRATAGWVAALFERAGLLEIDRRSPARVRLREIEQTADEDVALFHVDEEGYARWLRDHPDGYVLSTDPRPRPGQNRLHRAQCGTISPVLHPEKPFTAPYMKVCGSSSRVVEAWTRSATSAPPERCKLCNP